MTDIGLLSHFLVPFFFNCKIIKCWIMFHQCCGIPQEKGTGWLLETSLSKSLNSCACNSQRQIGHTGLSCRGRRKQVSIEDGYVVGSVYTVIESFKIFLEHLKSDRLLIAYMLFIGIRIVRMFSHSPFIGKLCK